MPKLKADTIIKQINGECKKLNLICSICNNLDTLNKKIYKDLILKDLREIVFDCEDLNVFCNYIKLIDPISREHLPYFELIYSIKNRETSCYFTVCVPNERLIYCEEDEFVNKILKNIMATGLQNLKKNSWGEIK
jgi:hypothetical protein